jgi:hypothetical protein
MDDNETKKRQEKDKRHYTDYERQQLINQRLKEKEVRKGYLDKIKELYR